MYMCCCLLQDLVKDLSSELSFRFKQTVLALMMTPVEYDAEQLYKAIKVCAPTTLCDRQTDRQTDRRC